MTVEAALNFPGLFKLPILLIWVLKENVIFFLLVFSKKPMGCECLSATVISSSEMIRGEILLSCCFSFPFSNLALNVLKNKLLQVVGALQQMLAVYFLSLGKQLQSPGKEKK